MKRIFLSCLVLLGWAFAQKGVSDSVYLKLPTADVHTVFHTIVPIPLEDIFEATGKLPAIKGTSPVASWDRVGVSRSVYLADGNTAQEEIIHYESGRYFAYRVFDFSNSARHVARYAVGQWWFTEKEGKTLIKWKYTFVPRNFFVRMILKGFVRKQWKPYMQAAMRNIEKTYLNAHDVSTD